MENEGLVNVSQVNDEFTLISLFFRADIVVKLVILILFASSILSWTIITVSYTHLTLPTRLPV